MARSEKGAAKRGYDFKPMRERAAGKDSAKGGPGGASGVDALSRGGGKSSFGGRSPFGQGKAPSVDLGASVGQGNRKTAVAKMGAGGDSGVKHTGHGAFNRM